MSCFSNAVCVPLRILALRVFWSISSVQIFSHCSLILSSGIVNKVPARPTTKKKKKSPKIALLPIAPKFGPQEVNRVSSLCAQFQPPGSFELYAAIFSNLVKMAVHSGRILLLVLRRTKVSIDEFRPNTSKLQ